MCAPSSLFCWTSDALHNHGLNFSLVGGVVVLVAASVAVVYDVRVASPEQVEHVHVTRIRGSARGLTIFAERTVNGAQGRRGSRSLAVERFVIGAAEAALETFAHALGSATGLGARVRTLAVGRRVDARRR